MQCSNALQLTGGFVLSVRVPRAHISRFSQHCQGQRFSRSTVWCWVPGLVPVQSPGSGVTRVHSPRWQLRPGQLVLALCPSQPPVMYITALECCLRKALHVLGTWPEEQPSAFQRKPQLPEQGCLSSLSARKSILAPLPGPAQVGFAGGVLWYLGCKTYQTCWSGGTVYLWVWGKLVKSLSSCVTCKDDRFSLGFNLSNICMQIQTFAAGSCYDFWCQRWLAWLRKGSNFKSAFLCSNKQCVPRVSAPYTNNLHHISHT